MPSKLIVKGEAKQDVRFRVDHDVAESLKALKSRVRVSGHSLTFDDEVQRQLVRMIKRANRELDEEQGENISRTNALGTVERSVEENA